MKIAIAIAVCGGVHYGQLMAATADLVTCLSSAIVSTRSPQHISGGKILVQYMAGKDAQ